MQLVGTGRPDICEVSLSLKVEELDRIETLNCLVVNKFEFAFL